MNWLTLTTRGRLRKRKSFECVYDLLGKKLLIKKQDEKRVEFNLVEIKNILEKIKASFGDGWLPLGNNVEKLYNKTERIRLGVIVYQQKPNDTFHAQGASYLGSVLEKVGILEWNGKSYRIKWRLRDIDISTENIERKLQKINYIES